VKVIRASERTQQESRPPSGRFRGTARQRPLHEASEASRVSFVSFDAGAHTHWHTHSGGQVLHVIEGVARVQTWGEPMHLLDVGDTVVAQPDEKHWHGAAQDAGMTQLAVTSGEVRWLEDVETD
jgi:quercetin dioxygenase-like cupin family protein